MSLEKTDNLYLEEKAQVVHLEAAEESSNKNEYIVAAHEELSEPESTWTVMKRNPRALCVMGAVLLNGIVCGIELNMAGNMMGVSSFVKTMGTFNEAKDSYEVVGIRWNSWTIASLAQLLGMFGTGFIGDMFGRRIVMYLIVFLNMIGAVMEATAPNWKAWAGAKTVMGFATGLMQAGVSTYIGEVAPREIRGICLSTFNLLMNLGNLFSTIICWGSTQAYPDINDNRAWRVPLYAMIALPLVILAAELIFLVESPYWLVMRKKIPGAQKSLRFLYPYLDEEQLEIELSKIKYTLEKEAENVAVTKQSSYLECFKGTDLRRTFCAAFPAFCQPLMGHVLTGPYSTYFFFLSGEKDSLAAAAICQGTGFAANFALYFIIDNRRIGRWNILFFGCLTMCISMMAIGVIGSVWESPASSATAGKLLIAFITIANMGSVSGPGAAGWTYCAESGSARLRAKTTTFGNLGNAIGMNIFANTFPYMLAVMNLKIGFFFGGLGIVALALIWLFIPDYTGRSYAQVDELFLRKIPARQFKTTECTGDYGKDVIGQVQ